MKIIEAMKQIKANTQKVVDLQKMIADNSAVLSHETPRYGKDKQQAVLEGWAQTIFDINQDSMKLLMRIQKTNLATPATITLGDKQVTKTLAEWVWRRRAYANSDLKTYLSMTDRGLRETTVPQSTGEQQKITIVRFYDPEKRDKMVELFKAEAFKIDAALEVVNAQTDLLD